MGDDIRLLLLLLLTSAVVSTAVWVMRLLHPRSWSAALLDAGLAVFAIQYVAVTLPGALGLLSAGSIAATALLLAGLLGAGGLMGARRADARRRRPAGRAIANPLAPKRSSPPHAGFGTQAGGRLDRIRLLRKQRAPGDAAAWGVAGFVALFIAGVVYRHRMLPPMGDDVLTYHLPAAAAWLAAGRITLLQTWDFNPANTFSPLAGSVLATWWIAPLGSDAAARFVQVPGVGLIFLAAYQLARLARAPRPAAALLAVAACCGRPILGQAVLAKDDVLLTAFVLTAVVALARRGRGWPLRAGVAVGLMLATKYTAVLSLPILLLALRRHDARPRGLLAIAGVIALALAGPWYVRNLWLTGNPLYPLRLEMLGTPLLPGPIATRVTPVLRSAGQTWRLFTGSFFSDSPMLLALLVAGWLAATATATAATAMATMATAAATRTAVGNGRFAPTQSSAGLRRLWRVVVLGVPLSVALFFLTSPYPETRFIDPAIALVWTGWALSMGALSRRVGPGRGSQSVEQNSADGGRRRATPGAALGPQASAAAGPRARGAAGAAGWGAIGLAGALAGVAVYGSFALDWVLPLAGVALLAGAGVAVGRWVILTRHYDGPRVAAVLGAVAAAGTILYGFVFAQAYLNTLREDRYATWAVLYAQGPAWEYLDQTAAPNEPVAYANSYLVLPLNGPSLRRTAVHVSGAPETADLWHLPRIDRPLTGEQINPAVIDRLNADFDEPTWMARLRASGARWLVVAKTPLGNRPPPELAAVGGHPEVFTIAFDTPAAIVLRIKW